MRKILFRGKRAYDGKWVEGYLGSKRTILVESPIGNIDEIVIIPATVGQYTGLKDRNDVWIFEGDIIKIPDDYDQFGHNAGERYEVIFRFGGFRLKPKYGRNAKGYWLEDDATVEVIGNIHDNPELLEAQS